MAKSPGIVRLLNLDADRRRQLAKYKLLFSLMGFEVRVKVPEDKP